jgi:hypothetical protein
MPLRSPPAPPRYDSRVERRPDPKHVFDRDPLLIPQLFIDTSPRWYQRLRWRFVIGLSAGAVVTVGVLAVVQGPRRAADTLGRAGAGVLHVYARLVAGGPG